MILIVYKWTLCLHMWLFDQHSDIHTTSTATDNVAEIHAVMTPWSLIAWQCSECQWIDGNTRFFHTSIEHCGCYHRVWVWPQIARFMGPTWGPPRFCQPHVGPMNLAIRDNLSGLNSCNWSSGSVIHSVEWHYECRFSCEKLYSEPWDTGILGCS